MEETLVAIRACLAIIRRRVAGILLGCTIDILVRNVVNRNFCAGQCCITLRNICLVRTSGNRVTLLINLQEHTAGTIDFINDSSVIYLIRDHLVGTCCIIGYAIFTNLNDGVPVIIQLVVVFRRNVCLLDGIRAIRKRSNSVSRCVPVFVSNNLCDHTRIIRRESLNGFSYTSLASISVVYRKIRLYILGINQNILI